MFVNVNAHPGSRPKALGQLGELSRARVILSEFKYKKGTEIFGEAEPADYIYQVADGAVRTHKLLSDGRRQIGAFHLAGDIFGLENGAAHRFTARGDRRYDSTADETMQPGARSGNRRDGGARSAEHDNEQPPACRGPHAAAGTQDVA